MLNGIPHLNRRNYILSDLLLACCIIAPVILFKEHADLVLLTAWLVIIFYLLLLKRYEAIRHQAIATLLAISWVSFAKEYYGYKFDYLTIFGMNTLPLMSWTLTLLGLGEVINSFRLKNRLHHFLIFVLVFWAFLIFVETVAFHVVGLRNSMTSGYEGLPFCDCLHAPGWMKVVYFSMAPVYYFLMALADGLNAKWMAKSRIS